MARARSAAYLVARLLAPFELLLFAIAIILVARQSSREPGAPQKDHALASSRFPFACGRTRGWINLDDLNGKVQTDHIAMGADSNNNGIADAWEFLFFGGLLTPGQQNNVGPNGNGMTLLQDYQDGVNPLLANSGLRITNYSTNAGGSCSCSRPVCQREMIRSDRIMLCSEPAVIAT